MSGSMFSMSPVDDVDLRVRLRLLSVHRAAADGQHHLPNSTMFTWRQERKDFHVAFGQMPDVAYPGTPDVVNGVPPGYLPGAIGYTRPQLQSGIEVPLIEPLTLLVRGCLALPVQTFQISDEFVGRQAGVPDFQGRVALGMGEPAPGARPSNRASARSNWGLMGTGVDADHLAPAERSNPQLPDLVGGSRLRRQIADGHHASRRGLQGHAPRRLSGGVFDTVNPMLLKEVPRGVSGLQDRPSAGRGFRMAPRTGSTIRTKTTLPPSFAREPGDHLDRRVRNQQELGFGLEGSHRRTKFVGVNSCRMAGRSGRAIVGLGGRIDDGGARLFRGPQCVSSCGPPVCREDDAVEHEARSGTRSMSIASASRARKRASTARRPHGAGLRTIDVERAITLQREMDA